MTAFHYAKTCLNMINFYSNLADFLNDELRYSTCYSIKYHSSTCTIDLKFGQHVPLTHTHHMVHIRNKHCQLHF